LLASDVQLKRRDVYPKPPRECHCLMPESLCHSVPATLFSIYGERLSFIDEKLSLNSKKRTMRPFHKHQQKDGLALVSTWANQSHLHYEVSALRRRSFLILTKMVNIITTFLLKKRLLQDVRGLSDCCAFEQDGALAHRACEGNS